jgi:hypothetical protein
MSRAGCSRACSSEGVVSFAEGAPSLCEHVIALEERFSVRTLSTRSSLIAELTELFESFEIRLDVWRYSPELFVRESLEALQSLFARRQVILAHDAFDDPPRDSERSDFRSSPSG